MTGSNYSLTGGFWSLISVVQTAGLPNLTITHSGSSVIVTWPDTGSYTLQQNANLALANGWATSGYTINTSQRHQQHHHHATHGKFILPPVQSLKHVKQRI